MFNRFILRTVWIAWALVGLRELVIASVTGFTAINYLVDVERADLIYIEFTTAFMPSSG